MKRGGHLMLIILTAGACASAPPRRQDAPVEAARHRAALATLTVVNESSFLLEIVLRSAVPPVQEIVVGRTGPGTRVDMAPVPAGEPVILVARRDDGAEYQARIQSFPLDGAVVWSIPKNATFTVTERQK